MNNPPYMEQRFFTGRTKTRTAWWGKTVLMLEIEHECRQGWLPPLISIGTPSRGKGDKWLTWRDATMDDIAALCLQIQLCHGNNT